MFPRRTCRFSRTERYFLILPISRRCSSLITTTTTSTSHQNGLSNPHHPVPHSSSSTPNKPPTLPPLSIMPTPLLLKSYLITSILASPKIIKFFLPFLNKLANSDSSLLNPDTNPVLHLLIRKFIYDHFIAGENASQVRAKVLSMKKLGFSGVILGYAREVNVSRGRGGGDVKFGEEMEVSKEVGEKAIREWGEGLMRTLELLEPGDFLSVKYAFFYHS